MSSQVKRVIHLPHIFYLCKIDNLIFGNFAHLDMRNVFGAVRYLTCIFVFNLFNEIPNEAIYRDGPLHAIAY
jgi:hypothetical protein